MINPHLLDAKYKKWHNPQFAGGKVYIPILSGAGFSRACRRSFKRASEAKAYSIRVRDRWIRLYDVVIETMVRE